jgi:hypothetical protein
MLPSPARRSSRVDRTPGPTHLLLHQDAPTQVCGFHRPVRGSAGGGESFQGIPRPYLLHAPAYSVRP